MRREEGRKDRVNLPVHQGPKADVKVVYCASIRACMYMLYLNLSRHLDLTCVVSEVDGS